MLPAGNPASDNLFKTKSGVTFGGASRDALLSLRKKLADELGLLPEQLSESASYSMAMVVRFALGLTAESGAVTALLGNGLCGCIAAATVRHLVNASTNAVCFHLNGPTGVSSELQRQLHPLKRMGVPIHEINGDTVDIDTASFLQSVQRSHNVIHGGFDLSSPRQFEAVSSKLNEVLNECRTPVHCIECPSGIDPDSGTPLFTPLFASSTLSLGLPLTGLAHGKTHVGRHYICDISLTRDMYLEVGYNLTSLFCEQPVVQIYPVESEEE
ncbi:MAG: NAD(P)H-hydrate epimerase [Deltaproteobacteria bacterium]|nr:NAD(P)H-hydrate epimerase [Deltaproteobacteria bacterium]